MNSIQIRHYKEDLSYDRTTTVNLYPDQTQGVVNAIVDIIVGPLPPHPGMMKMNLCNLMVREKGKLVSYKKFAEKK